MPTYNEIKAITDMKKDDQIAAERAINDFLLQETEEMERKKQMDDLLKDRRKIDEFIIENMRDLKKDIREARNEIGEVKADVQMVSTALHTHATDEMQIIGGIQSKHKDALYGMTEESHVKHHRDLEVLLEERKNYKEDTRKIVVDTKTKITWAIVVAFGLGLLALTDKYIDTNHAQTSNKELAEAMEKAMDNAFKKAEANKPTSMRQP